MDNAKEEIELIHSNLLQRLKNINDLMFVKYAAEGDMDQYTKIISFNFISCAIEAIIGLIIEYKYQEDKFAFSFINKKNRYSGQFLESELLEDLINDIKLPDISTSEFTNVFYPVCQAQIKQCIERMGEQNIFEKEDFINTYSAVKKVRNSISHEFFWNYNLSDGMLVKFLKAYYKLYCYALALVRQI